jgi:hypothetical protein
MSGWIVGDADLSRLDAPLDPKDAHSPRKMDGRTGYIKDVP